MNATLPGVDAPVRDVSKSQWFTPRELAQQIGEWATWPYAHYSRVLEPSCGDGALIAALPHDRIDLIVGVDIDPANVERVSSRFEAVPNIAADCADFMVWEPYERYDLAVMNPPFEGGAAEAHVMRALQFADRVVCHCPLTTLEGKTRKTLLWGKVQLHRMVIHSSRPKYGERGGATAMCTIDVSLRTQATGAFVGANPYVEWW